MSRGKPFTSILFPADTTGCSFYRMSAPYQMAEATLPANEVNMSVTRRLIADPNYFDGVNMAMLQRQVSDIQEVYFNKFLLPISKKNGMWVVYNIDDVIHKDDLPKYNKAWGAYQDDKLMENITQMLQSADMIVTTTPYIRNYYHTKFGVPLENITVIPNYLPHWWMGGYYDIVKTMRRFDEHRWKPRIGIISSTTHFDILKQNDGVDDLTALEGLIRSTTKKYRWVFFGTIPPALTDLVDSGEIEVNHGCDIYSYPFALSKQNLNAIVAPLLDNEFNKCKSNIKQIEAFAMGIPIFAQNLEPYQMYPHTLFDTAEDLQNKMSLLFQNKKKYKQMVEQNKLIVDNGCPNAPNGWWLERNLSEWVKLFKMRTKCMDVNIEEHLDKNIIETIGSITENPNIQIIT